MIDEIIKHHSEPSTNDNFKTEPFQDASFRRRVSGLPVRNTNPPALAGGCLVNQKEENRVNSIFHHLYYHHG